MNIFHVFMYDKEKGNAFVVAETAEEAAKLFTKSFSVAPDMVLKETYGDIRFIMEKKGKKDE